MILLDPVESLCEAAACLSVNDLITTYTDVVI